MEGTNQEQYAYEPYVNDVIFHLMIILLGIICPLYYYKITPNIVIFAKSQLFYSPSILPWTYTPESYELISEAKNLSDEFYLDLMWRRDSNDERVIRSRELDRIRRNRNKVTMA